MPLIPCCVSTLRGQPFSTTPKCHYYKNPIISMQRRAIDLNVYRSNPSHPFEDCFPPSQLTMPPPTIHIVPCHPSCPPPTPRLLSPLLPHNLLPPLSTQKDIESLPATQSNPHQRTSPPRPISKLTHHLGSSIALLKTIDSSLFSRCRRRRRRSCCTAIHISHPTLPPKKIPASQFSAVH